MKNKVYLIILILAIMAVLTEFSNLVKDIIARGVFDVNYWSIIIPILVLIISFRLYKKQCWNYITKVLNNNIEGIWKNFNEIL